MPLPPPTRPHTAHPLPNLSLLPRSTTPRPPPQRGASMASYRRETDWEDAWDSSSDKEDHDQAEPMVKTSATVDPIPIRSDPQPKDHSISASWQSSFQHVSLETSPNKYRPNLQASKSYSNGIATLPGTAAAVRLDEDTQKTTRLPPGGAWEIVEPEEGEEKVKREPAKTGKEAVREDVDDILRGRHIQTLQRRPELTPISTDPLQLLHSLAVSSCPPTPSSSNPSSAFPFLPSTPNSSSYPYTSISPENTTNASSGSTLRTPSRKDGVSRQRSVRTERRREKFGRVLKGRPEDGGGVEVETASSGAAQTCLVGHPVRSPPHSLAAAPGKLLVRQSCPAWPTERVKNYLPLPSQPRLATLTRKRKEYSQLVDQYFGRGLQALDQQIWHQIEIDVPRTRPGVPLWSCITAQRSLERILYVWAIRHPASGYVQGINDLVTPFFQVFLSAYIDIDPELFDVVHLDPSILAAVEADSFWCLSKLLDGIQDNYISQQPGIQRLVKRMGELVKRIDAPLAAHFEDQGVEFMQFAFRWMNCLLMREISVNCTIRMWDTYLAEGTDAFSQFHLYVCSALLVKYSERLREMDFQEMIMFLQCLPTQSWTDHDIELLLSEAYVLKTVWQGAENHFANLANNGNSNGFGMLGR
ncbi:TBC1 domain family member 2, partial [Tremellales sp. Uapishka_1]